jgi:hypothetical protein
MKITNQELATIKSEVSERVRLSCDEYHAHSYLDECFAGDPRDLLTMRLIRQLEIDRSNVREIVESFDQR